MKADWAEYLFGFFMGARKSSQWEALKNLHDKEDRDYFEMLEQSGISGDPWPGIGGRLRAWAKKDVRVCS